MKKRAFQAILRSGGALSVLLAVLLPTLGWAQQRQEESKEISVSKVERKHRAPVSNEVLRVKLPRPQMFRLSNGLTVLVAEDHRFPTISVQLRIDGAGGLYQPEDNLALASATVALLDTGTTSRTSKQIAEEQDSLGMTLGGGAGISSTAASLNASGLSDNFEDWFGLFTDVLLNPIFPPEEVDKYVRRQKARLRQIESLPSFIAISQFSRAVYGDHRLRRVFPSADELDTVTQESLRQWHRIRFTPQNSILGVVGDVNARDLKNKMEKWLEGWHKTDLEVELPEGPSKPANRRVILVHRPGSVQTTLRMGNLAIARSDPDYYALTVMNRILGGGPASRLFLNIREEKGYTYGVGTSISAGQFVGPWQASSDVRTEVTGAAMLEFFQEFNRIRNVRVSEEELNEAKRAIVARFALQLENPGAALGNEITRRVYGFPEDYWDTYPARIMEITADDVLRVARQYLTLDDIQIVAVGDATRIAGSDSSGDRTLSEIMEAYGSLQLLDAGGNKLEMGSGADQPEEAPAEKAPGTATGRWDLSLLGPGGSALHLELVLNQKGNQVSGKLAGFPGGTEVPVEGAVQGESVRFAAKQPSNRGEVEVVYSGKLQGNRMEGDMKVGGARREWKAARKL